MSDLDFPVVHDHKKARILIVDDEAANVRLLEKILLVAGYENLVCTQDPLQVLALHQKYNSDLILLDLTMPKLDGFGVMQQITNLQGVILPSILVLTAQNMQSLRQRALDNGAHDYVTKPFYTAELLSRMRNLLEVQMAKKFMQHQKEILEQRVRERTRAIHDTRLQIVRHLGRAAEYRDNETGLHIIRMSKIAVVICQASGMTDYQCELLLNAAPMHDIGKIGIPDHILLKPGKLDADEWEVMKTHSQVGADILCGDDSELMVMAHDIAISHHEKWNGKGYPYGLKGYDIPIMGRITAIADVFDALTSERPYKKAWSAEKAAQFIRAQGGQHFDPRLVSVFLDEFSRVVDIMDEFSEPVNAKPGKVFESDYYPADVMRGKRFHK